MSYSQTATQMEAIENWAQNKNKDHKMPPIILSAEESSEFTSIMADIKTYNEEMMVKFVMGAEPVANIDKYWKTVNSMNIKRAIEIQQKALDRYNKR
jgi:putative aldouronate transport system substrate-binding protein